MADLTLTQQMTVKRLLGWETDDTDIDSHLVGLSDEGLAAVEALLTRIDAIEQALDKAALTGGRFKRIEEVEYAGNGGIAALEQRLAELVRQLAALLGAAITEHSLAANSSAVQVATIHRR